jgi:hypothetical protein
MRRLFIAKGDLDETRLVNARPRIDIPAGNVLLRVYPIGTVIVGIPVVGEKTWLLSPDGVLRSPINRGTLLHVG